MFLSATALLLGPLLALADNNFRIVGDGLVSAQQLFVASENVVYSQSKSAKLRLCESR